MERSTLASKKNVIILSAIAVATALLLGSYYTKKAHFKKEIALGGQIEIVSGATPLSGPEYGFMRANALRDGYAGDLRVILPLPSGAFETNVRVFDGAYPLRGVMDLDRSKFKVIYSMDPKIKEFGVAVNETFLTQTNMKIGDKFTMGGKTYVLHGLVSNLPDARGQELLKSGPLLMLRGPQMNGSGMFMNATKRTLHYYVITKNLSPKEFQQEYKRRFPNSASVVNRADAQ